MRKLFGKNKNALLPREMEEILGSYEERLKETEVIKEYRDSCPNYKAGKCAGAIFIESRSGCNFCLKKNVYDLNNAEPQIGSREYEKYQAEKSNMLKSAAKDCDLYFDEHYCRYKHVFNYCSFCNKEFRRER